MQRSNVNETLRHKHVRTLELLQKTLDENERLRALSIRTCALESRAATVEPPQPCPNETKNPADPQQTLIQDLRRQLHELERSKISRVEQLELAHVNAKNEWQATLDEKTERLAVLKTLNTRLQLDVEEHERQMKRWRSNVEQQRAEAQTSTLVRDQELTNALAQTQAALARAQDQVRAQALLQEKVRQEQEQVDTLERDQARSLQLAQEERQVQITSEAKQIHKLELQIETLSRSHQQALETQHREFENLEHIHSGLALELEKSQRHEREALRRVEELNEQLRKQSTNLLKPPPRQSRASISPELPDVPQKSLFASHVQLKKENQLLRHQVEEMKMNQRKYLSMTKKQTIGLPHVVR